MQRVRSGIPHPAGSHALFRMLEPAEAPPPPPGDPRGCLLRQASPRSEPAGFPAGAAEIFPLHPGGSDTALGAGATAEKARIPPAFHQRRQSQPHRLPQGPRLLPGGRLRQAARDIGDRCGFHRKRGLLHGRGGCRCGAEGHAFHVSKRSGRQARAVPAVRCRADPGGREL
jgi:hypothetical protein